MNADNEPKAREAARRFVDRCEDDYPGGSRLPQGRFRRPC